MMDKKGIFKFWDSFYERCPECGYSWGSFLMKNGKKVHKNCPRCGTLMVPLTIEEKEFMYTRM